MVAQQSNRLYNNKMKKYQLIIFDWDGTLYDSAAHIIQCMQQTAKDFKVKLPDVAALRQVIGLSFEKATERNFPEIKEDQLQEFAETFRRHMYSDQLNQPALFEGTYDVLNDLKKLGYWLSIATGKSRPSLDRELKEFALKDFFMTSRCACETQSKPHPQMLLEIMDELGRSPNETLMIGDTIFDLELAANASVDALAVNYGAHDEEDLLKHDIKGCLSDIRQLPKWINTQS